MLDITGDDISALSDGDLRSLIGLLCEADLRAEGLIPSEVTWGGNQDAPDGGLDVRVNLKGNRSRKGFIPHTKTGFQTKATTMSASAIRREMRPRGKIRAVITQLARQKGAYIIVSSRDSTSDSTLSARLQAMRDALKGSRDAPNLKTDFFDRGRVATWVRNHPGLSIWVRQRAGRQIRGWRSYEAWAHPSAGIEEPYLVDEHARISDDSSPQASELTIVKGLEHLRTILRRPRTAVRLVGLSGVGKTRFVQALFDDRVGAKPLDPSKAFYTNLNDDPEPQPIAFASQLVADHVSGVLLIDNCPPPLHRRLVEVCRQSQSMLSVITIEYDIRDDSPEDTSVFRLEAASSALIERLLSVRFPSVSDNDRQRLSDVSGGNARLAIAIAFTLRKGESLAALKDEDLFLRLFEQRHGPDATLLGAAEVCSLVYSFEGVSVGGDTAEVPTLAILAGMSSADLYKQVAKLQRRDLVQRRGAWRAVLPHAIANRLAANALENIPYTHIHNAIVAKSSRLAKSFSRRLSYLHDSVTAVTVAQRWMAADGLLSNPFSADETHRAMFINVAPLSPSGALAAIARSVEQLTDDDADWYGRNGIQLLLRKIAYEPELFDDSIEVLAKLAVIEQRGKRQQRGATDALGSLFTLYFSGTHAPVDQRVSAAKKLLLADDELRKSLGLVALKAMLQTGHFVGRHDFSFGARSRDYGSHPRTRNELRTWYRAAIELATETAVSEVEGTGLEARETLASQFGGLWRVGMHPELESAAERISAKKYWREGWLAAKQAIRFEKAAVSRLKTVMAALQPIDLVQKAHAIAFSEAANTLGLDDTDDQSDPPISAWERRNREAESIGEAVARDPVAFAALLPEMIIGGAARRYSFGRGLARAENAAAIWGRLIDALSGVSPHNRALHTLVGFLGSLAQSNTALTNLLLDEALDHSVLRTMFPILQAAVPLDRLALNRLDRCLDEAAAPVWTYSPLIGGRTTDPIPGATMHRLLSKLAAKEGGIKIAINILQMRVFSDQQQKRQIDPALVAAGRALLRGWKPRNEDQDLDHSIGELVELSCSGSGGKRAAQQLCGKVRRALSSSAVYAFHIDHSLRALFSTQAKIALTAFFGGVGKKENYLHQLLTRDLDDDRHEGRLLAKVSDEIILEWCQEGPEARLLAMGEAACIFRRTKSGPDLEWTPLARELLARATDKVAIFKAFLTQFFPTSWSGSRAAIVASRATLLEEFVLDPNPAIARPASEELNNLRAEIARDRSREQAREQRENERFE